MVERRDIYEKEIQGSHRERERVRERERERGMIVGKKRMLG